MKICIRCGIEKNEREYPLNKNTCKKCKNEMCKIRSITLIENHQCRDCAKPIEKENKNTRCFICLEKKKLISATRYKILVKNHQCKVCAKPIETENNTTYCFNCLEKHRIVCSKRDDKLVENHQCRNCSKPIEIKNESTYCFDCLEKVRIRSAKKDAKLVETHKCRNCGKIIENNNNATWCFKCLEKNRIKIAERDIKLVENHQCRTCSAPIEDGNNTTYCLKCSKNRSIKHKKKRKEDINYKIRMNLSNSIRSYLRNNYSSKNGNSCLQYLPYTIDELKKHLEIQFEWWMTWNNHGNYRIKYWKDDNPSTWKWQIDHIIPCDALPYTSMEDENFKKCWALENLRPLSAKENIKKGNKIIDIAK